MTTTFRRFRRLLAASACAVLVTLSVGGAAVASGPPSSGPYPKQHLEEGDGPLSFVCRDPGGAVLYDGPAWTLEPLVRGPGFAPVALYLPAAGNVPVMPLDFTLSGLPIFWRLSPDGPVAGTILGVSGRPVGYGSTPTDTAPRVECTYTMFGFHEFGGYRMTASLVRMLGLPTGLIGRTVYFDNEASVRFTVPRYLFPLTAHVVHTTLPTVDRSSYARRPLPTVTCRLAGRTVYHGAAYTLDPLVRGFDWAPMAFWLDGDRIVTPQWFRTTVTGTWQTADGAASRHGTLAVTTADRPRGYGDPPTDPTSGVDCHWASAQRVTVTVSRALAGQLGLPSTLVGRRVLIDAVYVTHAYAPTWLFPPA